MVATKESVISNISDKFGVDVQDAEKLLAYDYVVRGRLNRMHATAQVAGEVQLQDGSAAEITAAAKEIVSAIPVFGAIAGLVGYGVDRATKAAARHYKLGEAANVQNMNPSGDPREWAEFAKDLSEALVRQKIKTISAGSIEDAEKLARKDSEIVAAAILGGKINGTILNPAVIPALAYIAQDPSKTVGHLRCERLMSTHQLEQGRAAAAA
jgi:hypothetical protein